MRGISLLWRSFALVAALSLIAPPRAFAEDLTEARIGNPPGVAAHSRIGGPPGAPAEDEDQGRVGLPPGAPATEAQGLWSWLMTWFVWFA